VDNFCAAATACGLLRGMGIRTAQITSLALLLAIAGCDAGEVGQETAPSTASTASAGDDAVQTSASPPDTADRTTEAPTGDKTPSASPEPPVAAVEAWRVKTQPMSAPVAVGDVVLYYTRIADALQLAAVDASTGRTIWKAPVTVSSVVTGVGVSVEVVDGQVALLTPAEGASPRQAHLELRDPATGDVTTRSLAEEFATLPRACSSDPDLVCAQVYRGGPSTQVRLREDGSLEAAQDEGLPGWQGIGSLGMSRQTGQHIGRIVGGELLWDLYLGKVVRRGASTNSGWTFQDVLDEKLIVASVGTRDSWSGDTITVDLTHYSAFALDPENGELVWKVAGADLFCDIDVPDVDPEDEPLIACSYTSGTAKAGGGETLVEDLDLDLVRLDPATGRVLWELSLGDGVGLVDGWRPVLAPGAEGTAVLGSGPDAMVVDLQTGEQTRSPSGLVTWEEASDSVEVLTLGERRSVPRVGVLSPTVPDEDGAVTWPLAAHVGAEVESDGEKLRVVAQPRSITAYSAP